MKKIHFIVPPLLCCLLFILAPSFSLANALKINAELSSSRFSTEDWSQLNVTVQGTNKAKIVIPEVEGLIIHDRGQNRFMQNINGTTTYTYSAMFIVQSLTPGVYTIPPITAKADGETLQTEPMRIEVLPSKTATSKTKPKASSKELSTESGSASRRDVAFITMTPKKYVSYLGEVVPMQIKAYFRTDLRELALPILHGDGILMQELSKDPEQKRELIDGQTYATLTWDTTITGVKEGDYPLHLTLDATILLKRPRGSSSPFGSNDPFSSRLFEDFFSGGYQRKNVQLKTEQATLTFRPLPEAGRPEHFTGAIGDFTVTSNVEPQSAEPGEPLSFSVEIAGSGNFDRVQPPEFPDPENFKAYQPSSTFDDVAQKMIFERAIVAKHDRVVEIPPVSFAFFDPEKGEYVEIQSGPLPLLVKAPEATSLPQAVSAPVPAVTMQEKVSPSLPTIEGLAPQKLTTGKSHEILQPVFTRGWFISLAALCGLSLLVAALYGIRRKIVLASPDIVHRRRTGLQLQKSIQAISMVKEGADTQEVLTTVRREVQKYFGMLWSMEPSAITLADLESRLNNSSSSDLSLLFSRAEQGVYGNTSFSHGEIQEYIKATIAELEKLS